MPVHKPVIENHENSAKNITSVKSQKGSIRTNPEGAYSHIFNRGVEKRVIFKSPQDYEVFIGFLKDYLTPPDRQSAKKTFTVNGRVFKGVPHQPKNYYNKVELIAYSLRPNHFHLILRETSKGSLERFIRSLCTRYSMYFNKKYSRSGSLFEGPYKSVHVTDVTPLVFLTRHIHKADVDSQELTNNYSSYREYVGLRKTFWIRPESVLSFFEKTKNQCSKPVTNYRFFVENYYLGASEKKLLEGIILDSESEHLARRIPDLARRDLASKKIAANFKVHEDKMEPARTVNIPGVIEISAAFAVFLLLVGLGIRNISAQSSKATPISSPTPTVSGAKDAEPIASDKVQQIITKKVLVVKITDGAESVNIRREPSVQSEKIGEAHNGEIFEDFVVLDSRWYQIKLPNDLHGFVSSRYIEEIEQTIK